MSQYEMTVTLKTGQSFRNKDTVNQAFVDAVYDAIANDKKMVIQVALTQTTAIMVPLKNVDYVQIKIK